MSLSNHARCSHDIVTISLGVTVFNAGHPRTSHPPFHSPLAREKNAA
jgi:hypothetical protein